MKKIISLCVLYFLVFPVNAEDNGGYAGAYLRTGLGARSISMGNTGVANPMSAYAFFYNPAIHGFAKGRFGTLSRSFMSLDRHVNVIGVSMAIPPEAGFTIAWIESGVGELYSYNSIGQETGNINHSASAVYFSFGRNFGSKIAAGISVKLLYENINDGTKEFDYAAKGVGFDFGLLYRFSEDLTFGYQLRDLKSKLKANTEKLFDRGGTTIDNFPVINKLGLAYQTPYRWLNANYEFEWSNQQAYKHHFGVEAISGENLALRFGLDDFSPVFGGGIDLEILKTVSYLDYAFITEKAGEGSSHVFTWQLMF